MTTELETLRQKVAEAVARRDAATPGPWRHVIGENGAGEDHCVQALVENCWINIADAWFDDPASPDRQAEDKANAQFIAAHHTDIETMQELMAKVEALEADSERLKYLYSGTRTMSRSLVDIELLLINGMIPSIDQVRAAIDDCMRNNNDQT